MRPETEEELSAIIRAAREPLRIVGGGTRGPGRTVGGAVLETGAMRGVTLYDPGALTLVARAGTPLAEVEAVLAGEGQRLPFEPMDSRALLGAEGVPSIGGMVAANASGPRRVVAGACRDSLIGLRLVDGAGAIIKNGGRVMKNVTGYDLVKLVAGSWGSLGVLTECAFKLLPVPETEATLLSPSLAVGEAVGLMSAALGTPYEVNAAARDTGGQVALRVEGFAQQVAYRLARLREVLGGDWQVLEPAASRAHWAALRDVTAFADREGAVWRVSTRASDVPALLQGLDCPVQMDWGGALLWLLLPGGEDLRARMPGLRGHATLIRDVSGDDGSEISVFHPEAPAVAALSRGLRRKFDPRGILNPGLMG